MRVVALRSRRLDALFGAPLDDLTTGHVRGLVDTSVQEAFDLDFKESLYGRGDADKRDLAGDVAALANTAGGVIVLGIEEDEQARAADAPGVEVSDVEVGRILRVVGSLVAPIPVFDVISVLDEPGDVSEPDAPPELSGGDAEDEADTEEPASGHGFLIIAVPRSPNAPHAVLVNQALRYPRRNGSTTRYLSEPEVAAAYRDRVAGAARQAERSASVEAEAIRRLDLAVEPWLVVSLVPDLPGDLAITAEAMSDFQRAIVNAHALIVPGGYSFVRASVGRRRLLADDTATDSPLPRYVSLELHADGAGVFAARLYDLLSEDRPAGDTVLNRIDDEYVQLAAASGVLWLAQHARDRAAAGGNALVRVTLVPSPAAISLEIGHTRTWRDRRGRPVPGIALITSEGVSALEEIATPGPGLISIAARLADELGQAFGIPELGQFSRDGRIRRRYWRQGWQQLVAAWADQNGIEVTDQTLARLVDRVAIADLYVLVRPGCGTASFRHRRKMIVAVIRALLDPDAILPGAVTSAWFLKNCRGEILYVSRTGSTFTGLPLRM